MRLDDHVASLMTRIEVHPSHPQDNLHTKRNIFAKHVSLVNTNNKENTSLLRDGGSERESVMIEGASESILSDSLFADFKWIKMQCKCKFLPFIELIALFLS